ncbi:MAG: hypothetical protein LH610_06105 [Sphingomonas bacterium]|nr:hypothetical protein [Sphingomonas bacterium]
MSRHRKLISLSVILAMSAQAEAADWQLQPAAGSGGAVLTFGYGDVVSYRFECAANEVIVTETGVTKLLDVKTGSFIGDDSNAVMPAGAALMALFSGKGDPQFVPASAVKNPAGGWNLTIRLAKNDKQLKAIGKSKMMSLFTTGYTMAVAMDGAARAKWSRFMQDCTPPAELR